MVDNQAKKRTKKVKQTALQKAVQDHWTTLPEGLRTQCKALGLQAMAPPPPPDLPTLLKEHLQSRKQTNADAVKNQYSALLQELEEMQGARLKAPRMSSSKQPRSTTSNSSKTSKLLRRYKCRPGRDHGRKADGHYVQCRSPYYCTAGQGLCTQAERECRKCG